MHYNLYYKFIEDNTDLKHFILFQVVSAVGEAKEDKYFK